MRPSPIADTCGPSLPSGRVGRIAIVGKLKVVFDDGDADYRNAVELYLMTCCLI